MKHARIFKDPDLLNEMLGLRRQGYSYNQLAELYRVDKTSIKHWCDQYNLGGDVIALVRTFYRDQGVRIGQQPQIIIVDVTWVEDAVEGRVRAGKSYAEYLDEAKKRSQSH